LLTDPAVNWGRYRAEMVSTGEVLERKRRALAEYRTQRRRPEGQPGWAVLDDAWFEPFLGRWEVFFPMPHADLEAVTPSASTARSRRPRVEVEAGPVRTVSDRFDDDRDPGRLIGSIGPRGALRRGRDAEGRLSADHGALRMAPLAMPGFGRESLAYGPFDQRAGLTFAALVLNGHNTSRTDYREEGKRAKIRRLSREVPQGRFEFVRRPIYDNQAVGWFTEEAPTDPLERSHAMIMHAATVLNGELRVVTDGAAAPIRRGIQNLPIAYVVVLRDQGAAYYAGSLPGAAGLAPYPKLRPLGIDPRPLAGSLFAGIHQSVLGEVDYRVSTRVSAVEVVDVEALTDWFSTATFADRFTGAGPVGSVPPDRGGSWTVLHGRAERGATGLVAEDGFEMVTPPLGPIGLVHLMLPRGPRPAGLSISLRADQHGDGLRVSIDARGAVLERAGDQLAIDPRVRFRPHAQHALQILDDGVMLGVHLDGALVFGDWIELPEGGVPDEPPGEAGGTRIGLSTASLGTLGVQDFEAHPREVDVPDGVELGPLWSPVAGRPAITDDFAGSEGELAGTVTRSGGGVWRRRLGEGRLVRTGTELRVDASVERPCPGRTLYTVGWDHADFAEIEIEARPPGSARGQGERGRAGLVFWQDPDNYLLINPWIDDYEHHDGSSISSFLMSRGEEDMYDAVWSNVGREVSWGAPYRLRVAFDGLRYLAWLGDEPVLFRSVTDIDPLGSRLRINEVGIATNWEWGDDTGSTFLRFRVRPMG
jgi:hypothetical protein